MVKCHSILLNCCAPTSVTKKEKTCVADPEQNPGTIHESNPENLLVLRLHAGTIHESNRENLHFLRLHAGTIHESNLEDLPLFKSQRGDDT